LQLTVLAVSVLSAMPQMYWQCLGSIGRRHDPHAQPFRPLLTVADLADVAVVADADEGGVEWPRPLVADGALVGVVVVSSVR
jgi:hypothetical protein